MTHVLFSLNTCISFTANRNKPPVSARKKKKRKGEKRKKKKKNRVRSETRSEFIKQARMAQSETYAPDSNTKRRTMANHQKIFVLRWACICVSPVDVQPLPLMQANEFL
jgi:hypothetical protein